MNARHKIWSIPNILTLLRVLITPVIVVTFYFGDTVIAHRIAFVLFLLASITDFLDGFLARKFKIQSNLGRIFDPIADKLMVGSVLLMLVYFQRVNVIPCLLILGREFAVAGLREFLVLLHISLPVSRIAKWKTAFQVTSISVILLGAKGSGWQFVDYLGSFSIWVAAVLTLATGYSYLIAAIKFMEEKDQNK
jgi:CDP-diacylglycerol--glycerol-3-phosphate 3-phosphatidyltransferase